MRPLASNLGLVVGPGVPARLEISGSEWLRRLESKEGCPFWDPSIERERAREHASHEALTLHSPVTHPGSPWLTLLARCECLKRHGVGEREGELGADFTSIVLPTHHFFENPPSQSGAKPRTSLELSGLDSEFRL
jgi:hypothetical protein